MNENDSNTPKKLVAFVVQFIASKKSCNLILYSPQVSTEI